MTRVALSLQEREIAVICDAFHEISFPPANLYRTCNAQLSHVPSHSAERDFILKEIRFIDDVHSQLIANGRVDVSDELEFFSVLREFANKPSLKELFRTLKLPQALLWCASVLLGRQNLRYVNPNIYKERLSVVFKLLLIVYDRMSPEMITTTSISVHISRKFYQYVEILASNNHDIQLIFFCFQALTKGFLNVREFFNTFIMNSNIRATRKIFESLAEFGCNMPSLSKLLCNKEGLALSHYCLGQCKFESFQHMFHFGDTNHFTSSACQYYERQLFSYCNLPHDFPLSQQDALADAPCMRYLQVVFLNRTTLKTEEIKTEQILRLLWDSIPDPYLCKGDFLFSFTTSNFRVDRLRQNIWKWYRDTLSLPDTACKCPRSLQHLSRCAVRSAMARNFQLRSGIQRITYPNALKRYLQLEI